MHDRKTTVRERGTRRSATPIRVLVAGPVTESGGLARIARLTAGGFAPTDVAPAVCDTSKDTPSDRSLVRAIVSHLRRVARFAGAVVRHKPHIVHLHTCSYRTFERTILDCVICTLLNRPYVLHVHGGLFEQYLDGQRGWRRRRVIWALRSAKRVIVVGRAWRTALTRQVAGLSVEVLHNAVGQEASDLIADTPPPGATGAGHTALPDAHSDTVRVRGGGVLFVGDLSEVKRPEDLIVAYASLPRRQRTRFPLTLVGGGDARRTSLIKRLAAAVAPGDPVYFTGCVRPAAVAQLMRTADLVVIPSRAEGLPLVLLEAMHASAAIVVTDVGAVREVVSDGVNAVIVSPQDAQQLALAMVRLLRDDARRDALARAARGRAAAFCPDVFRTRLLGIWREVAAEVQPTHDPPLPRLASASLRFLL